MLQVSKVAQFTGHNASVYSVIPGYLPGQIFSGGGEGWLVAWNLEDPEMGKLLAKVETQIFSMCRLEGQQKVVVGNMNGGLHWVDIQDPAQTRNIAHHKRGVYALTQVGDSLFSGGGDGLLTRWDIPEARTVESLQLSSESIRAIAFSPERNELAVGASDHNIYLVDASSLQLKHTYRKAHDNSVFTLAYDPGQMHLFSGGRDAHLKAWELDGPRKCISGLPAHWFTINSIAIHPQGSLIATGSRDKTIRIWDSQDFKLLKTIDAVRDQGHINSVNHLYWSAHQNWLISASDDRRLIAWEIGF